MKVSTPPRKVLPVMAVIVKIVERGRIRVMLVEVPYFFPDNGR
jgi:hypothetical protein